jgi:hypothetical protein
VRLPPRRSSVKGHNSGSSPELKEGNQFHAKDLGFAVSVYTPPPPRPGKPAGGVQGKVKTITKSKTLITPFPEKIIKISLVCVS